MADREVLPEEPMERLKYWQEKRDREEREEAERIWAKLRVGDQPTSKEARFLAHSKYGTRVGGNY